MTRALDRTFILLLATSALCACILRHPSMDSIRGSTPLVIENSSGAPVCELTIQRWMSGIEPAAVAKPGTPFPAGSRVTWNVGTFDLDVIARNCSHSYKDLLSGEIEHLKLTGPTVLGIGGPVTDAPAGYAVKILQLTDAPTPTDRARYQDMRASQRSNAANPGAGAQPAEPAPAESNDCLPAGTATSDTSKCCSALYHTRNGVDICG